MTRLLSVVEAADRLGVSQQTIRAWIRAGYLVAVKAGRRVLLDERDLEAFIETHKQVRQVTR
jgi:excisionase family DNA binding protein